MAEFNFAVSVRAIRSDFPFEKSELIFLISISVSFNPLPRMTAFEIEIDIFFFISSFADLHKVRKFCFHADFMDCEPDVTGGMYLVPIVSSEKLEKACV